ncbi:hypothetical protein E2C01_066767 [Portunus trituberculatus]|uniref:Uncharacterized protein n=1 Tax=Portunus trituberculatus TaxID=210409 RepID=A0A5B7HJ19_PORTR|nr:hypothetical protein [Portunus trituberculatus]
MHTTLTIIYDPSEFPDAVHAQDKHKTKKHRSNDIHTNVHRTPTVQLKIRWHTVTLGAKKKLCCRCWDVLAGGITHGQLVWLWPSLVVRMLCQPAYPHTPLKVGSLTSRLLTWHHTTPCANDIQLTF